MSALLTATKKTLPQYKDIIDTYVKLGLDGIFLRWLNPYGFAFNRRANEDNIDLNRNFLSKEEFEFVTQRDPNFAEYVNVNSMLNPDTSIKWSNNRYINLFISTLNSVYYLYKYGELTIKKAMVSGNYYNNQGLYYGGTNLTNSAKQIQNFLNQYFIDNKMEIRKVIVIDVHTGLGYSGVDTLAIDGNNGYNDLVKNIYNDAIIEIPDADGTNSGSNDAMSGYELMMGGVAQYFCGKHFTPFVNAARICITQEFGTVPPFFVALALFIEARTLLSLLLFLS